MKPERKAYLDIAKGIGIICVIIGHCSGELQPVVYTFHIPLFFLLTGYTCRVDESFKTFVHKKFYSYLLPYITGAIFLTLYIWGTSQWNIEVLWETLFAFLLQIRFQSLWFLAALFVSVFIFRLICHVTRFRMVPCLVVSFLLVSIFIGYDIIVREPLIWNIDTAFIAQIYLATGYWLHKKNIMDRLATNPKKIIIVMLLLLAGTLMVVINNELSREMLEMYWCYYGIYPLTVGASILISMSVILLSGYLERIHSLVYLGQNTMIYFIFHQCVGIPMAKSLLKWLESLGLYIHNAFLYQGTMIIIVILICTLILLVVKALHIDCFFGYKKKDRKEMLAR